MKMRAVQKTGSRLFHMFCTGLGSGDPELLPPVGTDFRSGLNRIHLESAFRLPSELFMTVTVMLAKVTRTQTRFCNRQCRWFSRLLPHMHNVIVHMCDRLPHKTITLQNYTGKHVWAQNWLCVCVCACKICIKCQTVTVSRWIFDVFYRNPAELLRV